MSKNTYVKFGYDYRQLTFNDGFAINDSGEIVGIQIGVKIENPISDINEFIKYFSVEDVIVKKKDKYQTIESQKQYVLIKEPKTIKTNAELRKELYKNGGNN